VHIASAEGVESESNLGRQELVEKLVEVGIHLEDAEEVGEVLAVKWAQHTYLKGYRGWNLAKDTPPEQREALSQLRNNALDLDPSKQRDPYVPKHQFTTKIENLISTESIGQKVLDACMVVTVGEFLGASPTVRAFINDMTKVRTIQPEDVTLPLPSKVNLANMLAGVYTAPYIPLSSNSFCHLHVAAQLQTCYFCI
jgi:hypothetical protein